uniref:hypothetical protein n=1 Tax=Stappia sp. TaxID=1870903 RepID=UPI003BAA4AFF
MDTAEGEAGTLLRARVAVTTASWRDALAGRLGDAWEVILADDTPDGPLPDLLVLARETDAYDLAVVAGLKRRAATGGARLPLVAPCAADGDPDAPGGMLHPDALLPVENDGRTGDRLAAVLRASVRLEEAILRHRSLPRLAHDDQPTVPASAAHVLVHGDSAALADAARASGLAIAPHGVLSPEAALARLETGPADALVLDAPAAHIAHMLEALDRDPRHMHLPTLVIARDAASRMAALEHGASDIVLAEAAPRDIGRRLQLLLGAQARRRLADARLERFRRSVHDGDEALAPEEIEAYRRALTAALKLRGRAPLEVRLEEVHSGPRELHLANDGIFPPPARDPVLTTALAASREEDFVARVKGSGGLAILRDSDALDALRRRIAAIVDQTRFG